jgi:hypothetical protein
MVGVTVFVVIVSVVFTVAGFGAWRLRRRAATGEEGWHCKSSNKQKKIT